MSDSLTQLETEIAAAFERVGPSLVAIGRRSRGTGFVIGPNRVVTNAHNLRDRTTQVTFANGTAAQAAVIGSDLGADLVVLEVETGETPPLSVADSLPSIGQFVFAAAASPSGSRISAGTVSNPQRTFRGPTGQPINNAIEHTAPLTRGSSGGPLLNRSGEVVGITTHRLPGGFAVSIGLGEKEQKRLNALSEGATVTPLRLGIAIAPPQVAARLRKAVGLEPRDGLLLRGVHPEGAAAAAGLQEGDLIIEAGSQPIATPEQLNAVLADHDRSTTLAVTVLRGAEEHSLEVTFE
jgi:S1-C subfamily serine protease